MSGGSCDEFYPYTNCPNPVTGYWYREYKRDWSPRTTTLTPYYPNTQTIYYVPVQEVVTPPVSTETTVPRQPRPERLGEYRERPSKQRD